MKDKTFHGAFVFRDQGHGILSSTYFNTVTPKPYPETAIRKTDVTDNDPFLGTFDTTWLEANLNFYENLKISKGYNGNMDAYHLEWANKKTGGPEWEGLGNLENGLLIGCYWRASNK
ncbi:MAG TPA: hypothetical protein VFT78_09130 [Hanamia sp.]|nr:hypothetical protein [Hanamia sp.]